MGLIEAYKNTDFALRGSLKKEAKQAYPDLDVNKVVQDDAEFAQFLLDIDPSYRTMDLDSKGNQRIVREKYLLYKQSKSLKPHVEKLYQQEITQALGVEIPPDAQEAVSAEMGRALTEMAQKNSEQFQRLKQKMEAYAQLKQELSQLEKTFEKKLKGKNSKELHVTGTEAIKGMKDRQDKLKVATASRLSNRLFNKDMDVFKADFGRMLGNKDMKHAVADFKYTYGMEKDELAGEFDQCKGDIKKAEELREKVDKLREYLLKDLDLGKKLIEVAQKAAEESLNASSKELTGVDRLDFMSQTDRETRRLALTAKATATGMGPGRGLPPEEQADLDRLAVLKEMDDLEGDPTVETDPAKADKKSRRDVLRKEQSERSKKRITTMEAARKLAVAMREGQGKKGGIDYSKSMGADVKVKGVEGVGDVNVGDLEQQLNNLIKTEVDQVLQRAATQSGKLSEFLQELNPYFEKWRIGGEDTRNKVTTFMIDTLKSMSSSGALKPVLQIQMKAYLAQRGYNPVTL